MLEEEEEEEEQEAPRIDDRRIEGKWRRLRKVVFCGGDGRLLHDDVAFASTFVFFRPPALS